MATKNTTSSIKELFNKNNCILLSEYVNYKTKLEYICMCGNIYSQTLRLYKKNSRCRDCSLRKMHGYKISNEYKAARKSYEKLIFRSIASQYSSLSKNSEALGYTDEEYYYHLKKFPEFYNSDWHIDHKFPIKAFTDHGLDTRLFPHIVNALNNLRPMCKQENHDKGHTYNPEEFMIFLREMNCRPLKNPYNIPYD